MSRDPLRQCTEIDLFRHRRDCVRVQRRVDRRGGERCHLRCNRFEGLNRESEDGGDVAGRGGCGRLRGERRGRAHARGWVEHGREGGTEAEYRRRFFVGKPVFGNEKGGRISVCVLQGSGGAWDVHAQYLGPFAWPEEVHGSTIAFGEWHWIQSQSQRWADEYVEMMLTCSQ